MALIGKVNDVKHERGEVRFANDLEANAMGAVSFMVGVVPAQRLLSAFIALWRQKPLMVDFLRQNVRS